jgi:hypothetical protein
LTNFNGPFAGIRELLRYAHFFEVIRYPESGIVEMVVDGQAIIHSQIIKGMQKSGYKLETFHTSTDPEYIGNLGDFLNDIEDEDDVPAFTRTKMRFKDTEPPPIENSNTGTPSRDPLHAEFVAAVRDSARGSCEAETYDQQVDDTSQ